MTLWQRKWEQQDPKTVPITASAILKEIDHTMYPKSPHVSMKGMCHDVTDKIDRTFLAAHSLQHLDIDFEDIIRRFARLHPRRMELANTLCD